jgi:ribose 5-phosphate isomerase B
LVIQLTYALATDSTLRIALGSDERSHVTDSVEQDLRRRGLEVRLFGPLKGEAQAWPEVAAAVAECVASGEADEGVLFCWTGTGVSIAANKVPGIRAALCGDAETARGAKAWNQANVLCLSLRGTSERVAAEILEAWFSAGSDPSEAGNVDKVRQLDERYRPGRRGDKAPTVSTGRGEKGRH